VREVVITAQGKLLTGVLTADDVLLTSTERDFETIEVALYFRGADGLEAEYRELAVPEGALLPARIVRALIAGPEASGLSPLLPGRPRSSTFRQDETPLRRDLSDAFGRKRRRRARARLVSTPSLSLRGWTPCLVLLRDEAGARTAYGNSLGDRYL
jgi:hypothetical protein